MPAPQDGAPDLQSLADRALDDLHARHTKWADAARQDAVESMRRLSRWHLVRRGCRVPFYDLYFVSMRRAAELLARRFIDQAAPVTADWLGLQDAELVLSAKGVMAPLELARGHADLTILQGMWEKRLDYMVRFEAELNGHLEHLYGHHLRPHLGRTIETITATWAAQVPQPEG